MARPAFASARAGPSRVTASNAPNAMTSSAPPRLFDRDLHRRRLDRAAPGYGAADFLKARAAADAVERLEVIMREFPLAVDLGARNGAFAAALDQSEAKAKIGALIEADLSRRMLSDRAGL